MIYFSSPIPSVLRGRGGLKTEPTPSRDDKAISKVSFHCCVWSLRLTVTVKLFLSYLIFLSYFVSGVQLKVSAADSSAWIAARFDGKMPPQMKLGDNQFLGGFRNRPLQTNEEYRVFVRAYTADDVRLRRLIKYSHRYIAYIFFSRRQRFTVEMAMGFPIPMGIPSEWE